MTRAVDVLMEACMDRLADRSRMLLRHILFDGLLSFAPLLFVGLMVAGAWSRGRIEVTEIELLAL
jgi:hypothetical protein